MLNSVLYAKLDAGDWPAFLECAAALLAAEGATLLVANDSLGGLEEYARSGMMAPGVAAVASAIGPRGGELSAPQTHLARFVEPMPPLPGLSEAGTTSLHSGSGSQLRQAVAPVINASGREVWLAITASLGIGDTAAEQDLLDRLSCVSLLVATRLGDAERMFAARCQCLVDGLALAAPISFLVTGHGAVVAASASAGRWLERGRLVSRDAGGRLRLPTAAASAGLDAAIADVALLAASDPAVQRIVRFEGRHAAAHWVAVVRPIAAPGLNAPGLNAPGLDAQDLSTVSPLTPPGRRPACWVALRSPRLAAVPDVEALRQAFNFTEGEAELVRHLMLGRTATSQAAERGVTPDAANHHMKNIYMKTGCRRHTELVMLVRAVLGCSFVPDIGSADQDDPGVAR